jgi:acyl-CoA synthetase (AMP-forming)/AMP-acid ligase II
MHTANNRERLLTRQTRGGAATLLDMAARHYHQRPDAPAVHFLPPDGGPHRTLSVRAFYDAAGRYAAALRRAGIAPRDLVILVMEHSEALLCGFWGAMMAGAIPSIFPFLTEKLDPALYFERVRLLIGHSGARAVIVSPQFVGQMQAVLAGTGVRLVSADSLAPADHAPDFAAGVGGADIAFLQHSSGTTGLQKGVALSHAAVLNQVAAYSEAIRLVPDDVIVSWLPLYHDMGLIAGFVLPLTQAVPLVIMSPFHWVRDPRLLLTAITRYRGTLCWLPNFAYSFMASRIREDALTDVDLSTMRAFVNCSEPMRAESHRQFVARFAPYGLSPTALTTCYAMAENTFAVTQGGIDGPVRVDVVSRAALSNEHRAVPAHGGELSQEMLSCGPAIPNCEVRVVDDGRQPLPERHIGEIAVRSDSMLTGYYRRDDLTAEVMFDGWYLTGDYGYIAEGEVYITGRKKDLIIVGGKNIYPQDIEAIAGAVPGIHPGRVVAFGVMDERLGTEGIVVVAEADTDDEDARDLLAKQIRAQVVAQTEVTLSDVYIVGAKWLHKTSSGKIARGANREKYLAETNEP